MRREKRRARGVSRGGKQTGRGGKRKRWSLSPCNRREY